MSLHGRLNKAPWASYRLILHFSIMNGGQILVNCFPLLQIIEIACRLKFIRCTVANIFCIRTGYFQISFAIISYTNMHIGTPLETTFIRTVKCNDLVFSKAINLHCGLKMDLFSTLALISVHIWHHTRLNKRIDRTMN